MGIKFVHTNIIAKDWKTLSDFYIEVFDCKPIYPERNFKEPWLEKGTGVPEAALKGIHLLLPGFDRNGPTLEIFTYKSNKAPGMNYADTEGYGHIAFQVTDLEEVLEKALRKGAKKLGDISQTEIQNTGILRFIYIRDPENNIIELQSRKNL